MLMTADLFYSKDGKLLANIESVYRGDQHYSECGVEINKGDVLFAANKTKAFGGLVPKSSNSGLKLCNRFPFMI